MSSDNQENTSLTPEEALFLFHMFREKCAGRFAEAYAESERQHGAPDVCCQIGADLEAALKRSRGSSQRIRAIIKKLTPGLRVTGERDAVAAHIEALDWMAARKDLRERGLSVDDGARLARIFGTFLAVAVACKLANIVPDYDGVAELTSRDVCGSPVSVTDANGAFDLFTRHVPFSEWVAAVLEHPAWSQNVTEH